MNKPLVVVLLFKIIGTFLAWCVPFLLFPQSWLNYLGFPQIQPVIYGQLLGWAYIALLVGYSYGLFDAFKGGKPIAILVMGIVSNLGASVILLIHGVAGAWSSWGAFAQFHMWLSTIAAFLIAMALFIYGFVKDKNRV